MICSLKSGNECNLFNLGWVRRVVGTIWNVGSGDPSSLPVRQRFPNLLGCRPLLLLNIFRGPPGGLANTKDNIISPYYTKKPIVKIRKALF